MERFKNIGVIKNEPDFDASKIFLFKKRVQKYKEDKKWTKENLVELFHLIIPNFGHKETGKYLDAKM